MLGVQADHWLVDNEHLRVVHERGDNRHPLTGAVRKPFDGFMNEWAEVKAFNQLSAGRLGVRLVHLEQLPCEPEEFPRGQLVEKERKVRFTGQLFQMDEAHTQTAGGELIERLD